MKDKEKQIDCDTCLFKEMCYYQEEITDCNEWAKEFQCVNYKPKIPEDSVVLSINEINEKENEAWDRGIEYGKQIASKEMAEKIYYMLKKYFGNSSVVTIWDIKSKIEKLVGVEIKEN